ncbi:MAG TPA: hypothetical protein VJG30_01605 [Candidatus Nanoarchaeia archaeon]|nr:hypothetical protein [Candidatus Nanoarchaeia archaeon]
MPKIRLYEILTRATAEVERSRKAKLEEIERESRRTREEILNKKLAVVKEELGDRFNEVTENVFTTYDTKTIDFYVNDVERLFEKWASGRKRRKESANNSHNQGSYVSQIRQAIRSDYKPDERIHPEVIAERLKVSGETVRKYLRAHTEEATKRGKFFYRRFKSSAEELVPLVREIFEENGRVHVLLLIDHGYGSHKERPSIGKALHYAAHYALQGKRYKKSIVHSSRFRTNIVVYHKPSVSPKEGLIE